MALIKTSNPALGQNTFSDFARSQYGGNLVDASARMTLSGTVNKTGILLLCAVATAAWTWNQFMQTHDMSSVGPAMLVGALGGLVCRHGDHLQEGRGRRSPRRSTRCSRGSCSADCRPSSNCAIPASPCKP